MRGSLRFMWMTACLLWSLCPSAGAQTPEAETAPSGEYTVQVEAGLAAYGEQRYADALTAFQAAHRLWPNARTHRGIGVAALQLGRLVLAREHLLQALADRRRPLSGALVESTREALHLAEAGIAWLVVELDAGAELWVDGSRAARAADGTVALDPGAHRVEARRGADVLRVQELDMARGERTSLAWQSPEAAPAEASSSRSVVPATTVQTTPAIDAVPSRDGASGPSLVGPITLAAVGGAAWIGAAITGGLAQHDANVLEQQCPTRQDCDPALQSRAERGATLRDATNVLLVGGVAAVVGAGIWWLLLPSEHAETATSNAWRLDLQVTRASAMATVGWTP